MNAAYCPALILSQGMQAHATLQCFGTRGGAGSLHGDTWRHGGSTDAITRSCSRVRPSAQATVPVEVEGAVAAKVVAVAGGAGTGVTAATVKVAVFDWDVHHGNGIQKVFFNNPNVAFFSIHRHTSKPVPFFPKEGGLVEEIGEGAGKGFNFNIAWPRRGAGCAEYMAALGLVIGPVLDDFQPDLIIVSAGYDAAAEDPLGECKLTPQGYAAMTRFPMRYAGGRLVLCFEGGYNTKVSADCASACTRVMLEEQVHPLLPLITHSQLQESAADTAQESVQPPLTPSLAPPALPSLSSSASLPAPSSAPEGSREVAPAPIASATLILVDKDAASSKGEGAEVPHANDQPVQLDAGTGVAVAAGGSTGAITRSRIKGRPSAHATVPVEVEGAGPAKVVAVAGGAGTGLTAATGGTAPAVAGVMVASGAVVVAPEAVVAAGAEPVGNPTAVGATVVADVAGTVSGGHGGRGGRGAASAAVGRGGGRVGGRGGGGRGPGYVVQPASVVLPERWALRVLREVCVTFTPYWPGLADFDRRYKEWQQNPLSQVAP